MENKVSITFCGGVEEVTGANFLFELKDGEKSHRVLVDCGVIQGTFLMEEKNREPFSYDPSSIDMHPDRTPQARAQ